MSFDATASTDLDPGDSINIYFWDFGDGTRAPSDVTTNHTYPAAGTYTVGRSVTDSHGATAITRHTLTVDKPNPSITEAAEKQSPRDAGVAVSASVTKALSSRTAPGDLQVTDVAS